MKRPGRTHTSIYLEPDIARAAKIKAAVSGMSVSDLANAAFVHLLREDAKDLELIGKRKGQPVRTYEEVLARLKKDGLI